MAIQRTSNVYERPFAVAFEELERRRRRDPAAFEPPEGARPGDLAALAARQFLQVLDELAGGLPWELVGHPAEPAFRSLLVNVPGAAVTLGGGPDEVVGIHVRREDRFVPGELEFLDMFSNLAVIRECFARLAYSDSRGVRIQEFPS